MLKISQQRFKTFKATIMIATVALVLMISILLMPAQQPRCSKKNPDEYTIRIPQLFILDDLYTNQFVA